jgi:putative endonuclease
MRPQPMPRTEKASSRSSGSSGEEEAARYLEERRYAIVARNFRSRRGEVDIIAEKGGTLVFVEVKKRSDGALDTLEYSVNEKKQRRIIETANYFLFNNRKYNSMGIRFDVIFVSPEGITHLESAFVERV